MAKQTVAELLERLADAAREEVLEARRLLGAEITRDADRGPDELVEMLEAPEWVRDLGDDELELFLEGIRFAARLVASPDYDY